ncbi:phage major capsid protein [Kumtagia ephedrae]|jgi:HK97 family phage major capsid protein|uniref:Phage major capsid protein n=1 Tax=Kumtagia ephedrae TaxID=2116701 RepID=A0A2P7SPV9_9HYPH|nr:phage major capsid protein [Mesorhizobium ephedrae]PSJ64499.1 phage major capsid protein [Mesorhizobium ephedrae]
MLKQLREKRAKLVAEMRGIIEKAEAEDRDLSAEEQTAFDAAKASKEDLDKRIERLEAVEGDEAALNAIVPAVSRQANIQRQGGPEAAREFETLGEFMHAVRFRPSDQRLEFVEHNPAAIDPATGDVRAEFRMDNDTSGGFMVPTQFRSTILRVQPQDALVRPRAQVIPAGSPPDASITMPALDQSGANPANMFGGMTFSWIEEGGDKPETDADLRGVTLTPHEIAGFVTVTDKLLRNWAASSTFIEGLMREGVNAAEDYAFLRGNGVTQPLGALNAGATKYINRAVANQVSYVDLVKMVAVLLMRGGTPVWSMSQSVLPQIAQMVDPEGHYIWQANAREGFAGNLLGYPVRWNNRAPALGTKGDVLLADWKYYLIKDGSGPFVAASEHVKFTSNKTVIKIFWNVDGAPWMHAPIKEENGYEVSPFVGLDIPA